MPGELQELVGERLGPYNSFNPVSAVQIWQWCSAMGDRSPLYLDEVYRSHTEFAGQGAVAPPAMMQMWTMRDFNDRYAPGSTDAAPYPVIRELERMGFPANVAVSYDISFHRYLVEGDRAHHYKTVVEISDLKTTALGEGHFFTDRMEYLDQDGEMFAEALITYFQYRPAGQAGSGGSKAEEKPGELPAGSRNDSGELPPVEGNTETSWQPDYHDLSGAELAEGEALPELRIPITHILVVGGAIATQDFIPVHHSVPAARAAGMPDVFMNILTTSGLCARYLSDWAGPGSRLQRLKFRLMAPNCPGDTMTMNGRITESTSVEDRCSVSVEFAGTNTLGPHVTGEARLVLAGRQS
jgi:hypothetical protein